MRRHTDCLTAEVKDCPLTFPYIDISFYTENTTHIQDAYFTDIVIKKSNIFPLVRRPFGWMMIPAPCNPYEVLQPMYEISFCQNHGFSHKDTETIPYYNTLAVKVECDKIKSKMLFVERIYNKCNITEILKLDELIVSEHVARLPCGSVAPPECNLFERNAKVV